MGNSINTRNSVVNMTDVAKVQNAENHRDDAQRQQNDMIMQKETAIKEEQVQTSNKTEHAEVNTKREIKKEDKRKRGKKRYFKSNKVKKGNNQQNPDEQDHIDLKID